MYTQERPIFEYLHVTDLFYKDVDFSSWFGHLHSATMCNLEISRTIHSKK